VNPVELPHRHPSRARLRVGKHRDLHRGQAYSAARRYPVPGPGSY
jgi:hypothetical protein